MEPATAQIDLHGMRPEAALGRLGQGLHAARVRGDCEVLVVTGRGWGNRDQQPVLRERVEAWLRGPDGRRAGVRSFQQRAKGGALLVQLG